MHRRLQNSLSSTKIVFFWGGGGAPGGVKRKRQESRVRLTRLFCGSLFFFQPRSLGQTFRLTARAFLNYAKMRAVLQYELKINSLLDLNLITMSMCYYLYV